MKLSDYTPARVGLGIAGESLPTKAQLEFRLAHAQARDAVHFPLDAAGLSDEMRACGWRPVVLRSAAANRAEYLQRPDKGRRLSDASTGQLSGQKCKTAIVVADGLSALAVHRHAVPFLKEMSLGDETALLIVLEGRVAVGDHIGELLRAELSIVILGERPGLTTPDSLGVYLTWAPRVGRTDAERNCISNIHGHGLSYAEAAHKLAFLTNEARRRKLSGVELKEAAGGLLES